MNLRPAPAFFFITLLMASTSFALPPPVPTAQDFDNYWNATSFDLKKAKELFLNAKNCERDEKTFIACFRALQALGSTQNQMLVIPQAFPTALRPTLGRTVLDLGFFSVVQRIDVPEVSAMKALEAETLKQNLRKNEIQALEKTFESIKNPRVEWDSIADQVLASDPSYAHTRLGASFANYLGAEYDPHTTADPTIQMAIALGGAGGSLVGIGVKVQKDGIGAKVLKAFKGSPADQAGIKYGDLLLGIGGDDGTLLSFGGKSLDSITASLRGEQGTKLTVDWSRRGQKMSKTIVRGLVNLPALSSDLLRDGARKIGYISYATFGVEQCGDFSNAVQDLARQNVDGLILDLRGNGGGAVETAQCIAGVFLPEGLKVVGQKVLSAEEMESPNFCHPEEFQSTGQPGVMQWLSVEKQGQQLSQLPLVVLIDAGSASAAEILSGALQDYQRAWLVGDRSFGKGTVQMDCGLNARGISALIGTQDLPKNLPEDLRNGLTAISVRQTYERFYQPSGRTNQGQGILPDFDVPLLPGMSDEDRYVERESDQYSNAYSAQGGTWKQPRPRDVQSIKSCIETNGKASQSYNDEGTTYQQDYQVLYAEDVLDCGIRLNMTGNLMHEPTHP